LVENVEIAWKALRIFEVGNADFSDALIAQANIGDGCEYTVTFDKQAAKLPGFDSLG
jgi:predicted nucleic-acid-binding protein